MIKYKCQCGAINSVPNQYPFALFKMLTCNCGVKAIDWAKEVVNPIQGIDIDIEYQKILLKQSKLSSVQRAIIIQMKG